MAKSMKAVDMKAAATAAGLDWQAVLSFLSGLDWLQLFQVIQQLIAILKGKNPMTFAAAPDGSCSVEQLDHAAAHFAAITELSECGAKCCWHS